MDQISRLVFDVVGRDRGGQKVLSDSEVAASNAHDAFHKLGDTLSGLGGPFGEVERAAGAFGDSLDTIQQQGKSVTGMLTGIGLGLTAAGVALIGFHDKEKQAQVQLENAITNTGAAYSDYQRRIEESVKSEERFGHAADDTMAALTALTIASQDPARAINDLSLATEIAANKHESLADAAKQLVLIEQGSTRGLKAFGIELDGQGSKAAQVDRALKELSDRLSGSASAATDTYGGKLKAVQARTEDFLSSLGKYGEWVTAVGGSITSLVALYELLAASKARNVAADAALIGSETQLAAAQTRVAATATAENVAMGRRGFVPGGIGPAKFLKAGLYAGGGYFAGQVASAGAGGGTAGSVLAGVGTGAGIGAAVGSVVPVIGTGIGAGVGAGLGGLIGFLGHHGGEDLSGLQQIAASQVGARDIRRLLAANKDPSLLMKQPGKYDFTAGLSSKQVDQLTDATDDQLHKALEATTANREYAKSLLEESNAATKAALSLDGQIKALKESAGLAIGLSSAEDGLQAAMHNLAQSVHDGSHALEGHSLAAEANRNALRDAASKMLDLIQAQKDAGVSGDKVRASALAMSDALERNAAKLLGNKHAVDEFLKGLGVLPPQIAAALGATEILSENVGREIMHRLAKGIDEQASEAVQAAQRQAAQVGAALAGKQLQLGAAADSGAGTGGSYTGHERSKRQKNAQDYGKQVADDVVSGYAPAVDSGIDKATSDAEERAKRRLERMKQLERQTAQQIKQEYRAVREQVVGSFNITGLPGQTDSLGAPMGLGKIDHQARQYVHQLETWAHLLGKLRRLGLNEVMIDQLEQAGIAAIPAMRQIIREHEIPSLNRSERRIRRIGSRVASADVTAHESEHLEHVLQRLPVRLATELARELKHLHIEVDLKDLARRRAHHTRNKS